MFHSKTNPTRTFDRSHTYHLCLWWTCQKQNSRINIGLLPEGPWLFEESSLQITKLCRKHLSSTENLLLQNSFASDWSGFFHRVRLDHFLILWNFQQNFPLKVKLKQQNQITAASSKKLIISNFIGWNSHHQHINEIWIERLISSTKMNPLPKWYLFHRTKSVYTMICNKY